MEVLRGEDVEGKRRRSGEGRKKGRGEREGGESRSNKERGEKSQGANEVKR